VGDYLLDPRAVWAADARDLRGALARRPAALILVDADLPGILEPEPIAALGAARRAGPTVILCGRKADDRLQRPDLRRLADAVYRLPDDSGRVGEALRLTLTLRGEPLPATVGGSLRQAVALGREALHHVVRALQDGQTPDAGKLIEAAAGVSDLAGSPELRRMSDLLRTHHDPTYTHSLRVAAGMALFGHAIGIRADDLRALTLAGLLHDVGKARLPWTILEKPAPLSTDEWRLVRRHPLDGRQMLRQVSGLPALVDEVAARHHERLDGRGYPHGLAGAEIDEPSLLCAIVDMHVALTEPRAYKPPLGDAEALALIGSSQAGAVEAQFLRRYRELVLDGGAAA
jgi:putative nucleotidyltransferase with HDIG domain